jgi:peptidoglycan/xylan/chitin deacetylase (PgdA/CDA1 family)
VAVRIVLVIFLVIFVYVGVPAVYLRYLRFMLSRKATGSGILALTFDDGPGDILTPSLIHILAEHNAKATFFLLGRNIAGRENIVRQLAKEGHQICSHGYDHLNHLKVLPMRVINDIKRGWQAIDDTLGVRRCCYPFRPPNGKLNLISLLYLAFHRVPIIYWTFDSGDTWVSDKRTVRKISGSAMESSGAVVLIHDFDRKDESVNKMVLESVYSALSYAKDRGLRVTTISQLLKAGK